MTLDPGLRPPPPLAKRLNRNALTVAAVIMGMTVLTAVVVLNPGRKEGDGASQGAVAGSLAPPTPPTFLDEPARWAGAVGDTATSAVPVVSERPLGGESRVFAREPERGVHGDMDPDAGLGRRQAFEAALRSPVLAVGAQLKSTATLALGRQAMLGPHTGDLENAATLDAFTDTVERLCRWWSVAPRVLAHDLHPGYLSTRFAATRPGALGARTTLPIRKSQWISVAPDSGGMFACNQASTSANSAGGFPSSSATRRRIRCRCRALNPSGRPMRSKPTARQSTLCRSASVSIML